MKEIIDTLKIIGGGKEVSYYLAGFFFAALGIIISLYYSSTKRNPLSKGTPVEFSWLFLIWDNLKRAVTTLIVMFILFRIFDMSNPVMMIGVGIAVSIAFDQILVMIMGWSGKITNLFSMDRSKFLPSVDTSEK